MRAVNLLPKDANQRGKSIGAEDPAVVIGSALGVVVLIAVVAGFLNVHSKVGAEQKKLTAAHVELARLAQQKRAGPTPYTSARQKPIVPVPAVTSEEQPRLDAISTALSTRIAWDRILREFSLVLPTDVTLKSLSLTTPSPGGVTGATTGAPAGGGAQNLTINGTTYSHDAVARLLSRLMLIPDLINVTLSNSTAAVDTGTVEFNITAGVKGAPAPPPAAPAAVAPATTTTGGATS
jgi:Tfp pilus assembly protein PilN